MKKELEINPFKETDIAKLGKHSINIADPIKRMKIETKANTKKRTKSSKHKTKLPSNNDQNKPIDYIDNKEVELFRFEASDPSDDDNFTISLRKLKHFKRKEARHELKYFSDKNIGKCADELLKDRTYNKYIQSNPNNITNDKYKRNKKNNKRKQKKKSKEKKDKKDKKETYSNIKSPYNSTPTKKRMLSIDQYKSRLNSCSISTLETIIKTNNLSDIEAKLSM